jgi:2-polyprenyl-3-methyl-5-hydroxy-6-metoxy-1,4-benzoquinol methylase
MIGSHDPSHFERLYRSNPDPWGYQTSSYEAAKYRHALDVLGDARFGNGLEVGCSIGVLTQMLAARCDAFLGVDVVDQALAAATARCSNQAWVRFEKIRVPTFWPNGSFDLIVLSEMLYFLVPEDIDRVVTHVAGSVLVGSRVLLVNWLGKADDPCSGDEAAERFIQMASGRLTLAHQDRRPGYRLDLLVAHD